MVNAARDPRTTEDKIAEWVKAYCESYNVPPENFFFDSARRAGGELRQDLVPLVNAVDFGGAATSRNFRVDGHVHPGRQDPGAAAEKPGVEKLQQVCHRSSSSACITPSSRSRCAGTKPKEVAAEGYKRMWRMTKGNRIEVESKVEMKERTKQSPDLFDALVTAVEGARRRGFEIKKIGKVATESKETNFFDEEAKKYRDAIRSKLLEHA